MKETEKLTITELRKFLKDRPAIALKRLAKECSINQDTLYRSVNGKRKYTERTAKALLKVLPKYGYKEANMST